MADHVGEDRILGGELEVACSGLLRRRVVGGVHLLIGTATIISEIGLLTHKGFIAVTAAAVQLLARFGGPVAAIT